MTEDGGAVIRRQQLVRLNVRQVPFTVTREAVFGKYKKSYLAKLVEEFSEVVDNGEYVFVDGDPQAFPWIMEIHRDGDYKRCIPSMSPEALEKELKFYELPTMSKLGILQVPSDYPIESGLSPMAILFRDILSEIKSCGVLYILPVDVFVYHEYKDGRIEGGERKILVLPFSGFDAKYITERGHGRFAKALQEGSNNQCTYFAWGKNLIPPSSKTEFWVVDFLEKSKLGQLNKEANKWEIQCTCCSQPYGQKGHELSLNVLRVQYQDEENTCET